MREISGRRRRCPTGVPVEVADPGARPMCFAYVTDIPKPKCCTTIPAAPAAFEGGSRFGSLARCRWRVCGQGVEDTPETGYVEHEVESSTPWNRRLRQGTLSGTRPHSAIG